MNQESWVQSWTLEEAPARNSVNPQNQTVCVCYNVTVRGDLIKTVISVIILVLYPRLCNNR